MTIPDDIIPDDVMENARWVFKFLSASNRDRFPEQEQEANERDIKIIARALMAERERCAARVEKKAVHLGRQECCGFGVGSPPECCADPVFMISNVEAAFAIRGGTNDR